VTSLKLVVVVLGHRPFQIILGCELHYPFISSLVVSICVAHLRRSTHKIFQILPTDFCGQVLDDHPVLGSGGSAVLLHPLVPAPVAAAAAAPAIPIAPGPAGVLNRHPRAVQITPVQVTDGVISITVIVELAKSVSAGPDENIPDSPVLVKEPLQVPLSGVARDVPHKDATAFTTGHRF